MMMKIWMIFQKMIMMIENLRQRLMNQCYMMNKYDLYQCLIVNLENQLDRLLLKI